jgi:hypothetical protein
MKRVKNDGSIGSSWFFNEEKNTWEGSTESGSIVHYRSCEDYTVAFKNSLPLYYVSNSGLSQIKYMGSQSGFEGATISGDCSTCFMKWNTTGWRRCKNPTTPWNPSWVDIGVPSNTLLSCSHNGKHLCAIDGSSTAYYQLEEDGDVMEITLPSPALYSAVLNDSSVFIGTDTHVYVVRNGSLMQLLVLSKPCFGVWADATNVWVSDGLFDEVGVWDGATHVSPNGGASWVEQTDALAVGPALYIKDTMHYKMTGWRTPYSGPSGPISPKSTKTLTYVLVGSLVLIAVCGGVAWMVFRSKPNKTKKNVTAV